MNKINKFNEFINNDKFIITELIQIMESDLKHQSDSQLVETHDKYKELLKFDNITKYLLDWIDETNIWYSTLSKLTGVNHNDFIKQSSERRNFWKNWAKDNGY